MASRLRHRGGRPREIGLGILAAAIFAQAAPLAAFTIAFDKEPSLGETAARALAWMPRIGAQLVVVGITGAAGAGVSAAVVAINAPAAGQTMSPWFFVFLGATATFVSWIQGGLLAETVVQMLSLNMARLKAEPRYHLNALLLGAIPVGTALAIGGRFFFGRLAWLSPGIETAVEVAGAVLALALATLASSAFAVAFVTRRTHAPR